jgi:hypothetical protein
MPGGDLNVAQVHARVEHGRDECYLYLILKSAWSLPVLAVQRREGRG